MSVLSFAIQMNLDSLKLRKLLLRGVQSAYISVPLISEGKVICCYPSEPGLSEPEEAVVTRCPVGFGFRRHARFIVGKKNGVSRSKNKHKQIAILKPFDDS